MSVVQMPKPPTRMVWVLKLNVDNGDVDLWLYRKRRLTGGSNGWAILCRTVRNPEAVYFERVSIIDPAEFIARAAVVTANEMLREIAGDSDRAAIAEGKAAEVSRLLAGATVEVKPR